MSAHDARPTLRSFALAGAAAALGLAGGGAAWVLVHLIGAMTNLALYHRLSWTLPSLRQHPPGPIVVVAAALGGLVVAVLGRWAPMIRGHGIPEAMEAVLERQSRIPPRAAVAKPASAAVAIGTGGPFGAEGPIIVTGGALGSLLGQVFAVSPAERKVLLACGAAAGMTATFGSPLAAVVLAFELLLFEFSLRALVPLVTATAVAGWCHVALFGADALFQAPADVAAGAGALAVHAALGAACGLLAVVVCRGLYRIEEGYRRLPVPAAWHPVIGGVAFGLVGLAVPGALGVGYDSIDAVLAGRLAVGALAVLGAGKLVAWWLALGSGTSGGTLAPLLLVGGCFGALAGHGLTSLGLPTTVGLAALVAMAATFGAATRAPLTAVVFAVELTHDQQALLPLMIAMAAAHLVSAALLDHGLMTEKLARRGVTVPAGYEPDLLASTRVRDVTTARVVTLPAAASVADARRQFARGAHSAYPVVDGAQRCVAMVSRADVLHTEAPDGAPLADVASTDLVTTRPEARLLDVLQTLVDEDLGHLPVVDDGRLVGIVTRTDLLRASRRRAHAELREPAWRPAGATRVARSARRVRVSRGGRPPWPRAPRGAR